MSDALGKFPDTERDRKRAFQSLDQNLAARRERRAPVRARVGRRAERRARTCPERQPNGSTSLSLSRIFSRRHRRRPRRVASNRLDRPRRETHSATRRLRHNCKVFLIFLTERVSFIATTSRPPTLLVFVPRARHLSLNHQD